MELAIFPHDSAPITLTTTIWLGVLVAVFFNLRFGWTLSGLVIPGYILPIFMARPVTAIIILLEAALTYLIVAAISELPKRLSYWSSVFGRDRFFLILLVSVLVRSLLDGWLLPLTGQALVEHLEINFDYRNNFNSFGLIAVALIANFFWKPGVFAGMSQILICTVGCYALVELVLQTTNFSVGSFDSIYADISLDLLKSPKCYIILLTTAYLASQMNLKYSWEFNGIMIPSLLALVWHSPLAVFSALLEAALILAIATLLLSTPWFQKITMEGGRKIAFFFSICFLYRFAMVHICEAIGRQDLASDFLGTGYLLSTLIATKAHDKKILVRMVKGITEISMLGAVAGSLVGFAFFCAPPIRFPGGMLQAFGGPIESFQLVPHDSHRSLSQMLRSDKIALYEKPKNTTSTTVTAAELSTFRHVISKLVDLETLEETAALNWANSELKTIGYELLVAEERYLYLRELPPSRGWGMFVIDICSSAELTILVPEPVSDWATLESGVCLLQAFDAKALVVSGGTSNKSSTERGSLVSSRSSLSSEFHRIVGNPSILEIRALQEKQALFAKSGLNVRDRLEQAAREPLAATQVTSTIEHDEPKKGQSRLWVKGRLPDTLDLSELRKLTSAYQVHWSQSPRKNQLRSDHRGNFIELCLSEIDRIRLVSSLVSAEFERHPNTGFASAFHPKSHSEDYIPLLTTSLNEWLVQQKEFICPQGSNLYVPTSIEQIMFMDNEVVTPLLRILKRLPSSVDRHDAKPRWLDDDLVGQLVSIQSAASLLGYQISILRDDRKNDLYVTLSEVPRTEEGRQVTKGWGIFVFRPGLAEAFAVEIPRPLFERRSLDFGMYLFQRPRSAALLVAGSHPRANLDGSSDICKAANRTNLFNLVRHSLLHELSDRPFLITQARAIQAPVETDLVMATEDGTTSFEQLTPLKQGLYRQLERDRLSITFVDGRPETAGYELGILMQAMSVQISENKEIVSLWLSPAVRSRFREHSSNISLAAQFEACEIPRIQADIQDVLEVSLANVAAALEAGKPASFTTIDAESMQLLEEYSSSLDILKLFSVRTRNPGLQMQQVVNGAAGHSYLMLSEDDYSAPILFNVTGTLNPEAIHYSSNPREALAEFLESGYQWLIPDSSEPHSNATTTEPAKQEDTHLSFMGSGGEE